jgi:integrase
MTARRRAAKGDGSVYFDANAGRWVASVTVTGPDGTRRRRKMTAPDKATAQRHLKTMLAERDSTGTVSRKDITAGQVLDRFLAHPPAAWKSRTTVQVNRQLANRIKRGLGHVLVSKLSAGQVSEHLRREITGARPLARRTVKDELALLRRALRWAEANDLASRNVAALADMPEGAATRRSSSLTPAQVAQVLSADLTPFWRAWMAVGLMCGLRPGGAAGLAWSDIGDDGVLRVRAGARAAQD